MEDNTLPLGPTYRDKAVSAINTITSQVPMIGPIVSEVITQLIPNQRLEGIEAYLQFLAKRLEERSSDLQNQEIWNALRIDIFEEGAFQSARALSEERLQYIANLVAIGITGEQREEVESRRLLSILASITDDQLIILTSYLHKNRTQEYQQLHSSVLTPEPPTVGSSEETRDQWTIFQLARQQLVTLGVLQLDFVRPRRGELPEFDISTGTIKARGHALTSLGRLLLRQIGLAETGEF